MASSLDELHPRLKAHLDELGWASLTAAQEAALPAILSGKHTLLVAPTGYGKTESALIPIFHTFLKSRDAYAEQGKAWPVGFKVLYVTPLRALNRDMMNRLVGWGEALGIEVGVRHGDTPQAERNRQSRKPPDVLITTPETVQILFTGSRLREHLKTVRWLVIDEVHEMASGERGAQFSVAMERLERVVWEAELERKQLWPPPGAESTLEGHVLPPLAQTLIDATRKLGKTKDETSGQLTTGSEPRLPPPSNRIQRIGLSATVGSPDSVAQYVGGPRREVQKVIVQAEKVYEIRVEMPVPQEEDEPLSRRILAEPKAAALVRRVHGLFEDNEAVLMFSNTRDGAEIMGTRFHLWQPDYPVGVHHGSLSRDLRIEMEESYKTGLLKALICTSSLELGIDVGQTDLVIQLNSPRGIERMMQRLGRAGHRAGDVSRGTVLCTSVEEYLEAAVIARKAIAKELPPIRMRPHPLEVLANQMISITQEHRALSVDWVWEILQDTQPFHGVPRPAVGDLAMLLSEQRSVWYEPDKGWYGAKGNSRRYFHDNISMIPDERAYPVIDASTRRGIGKLDESFVLSQLAQGSHFILRGRPWMVAEIREDSILVAPVKDVGNVPNWVGEDIPVDFNTAMEVGAMRDRLSQGDTGAADIQQRYHLDDDGMQETRRIIDLTLERGLVVATDRVTTIETIETKAGGRAGVTVINGCWGTQVNETLGRLFAALLAARRGASVGLTTDAYRIVLEARDGIDPDDIEHLLLETDPHTLGDLLRLTLKNSSYVKWQLVHVARKFGALGKQLDPAKFSMRRLLERFAELPILDEALDKIVWERMDIENASEVLKRLQDGRIDLVTQRLSPIGRMGLESRRDLMAPERADRTILDALRRRLLESKVALRCTNCGNAWTTRVERVPDRPRCAKCDAIMIAAASPWREDSLRTVNKRSRTEEETKEAKRLYKGANLVATYGKRALIVLVARGVGPDVGARILGRMHDDEYDLLRDILQAELTYARTRGFW